MHINRVLFYWSQYLGADPKNYTHQQPVNNSKHGWLFSDYESASYINSYPFV